MDAYLPLKEPGIDLGKKWSTFVDRAETMDIITFEYVGSFQLWETLEERQALR